MSNPMTKKELIAKYAEALRRLGEERDEEEAKRVWEELPEIDVDAENIAVLIPSRPAEKKRNTKNG